MKGILLILLFSVCAYGKGLYQTPTIKTDDAIVFDDDIKFAHLSKAIKRQKIRFAALRKRGVKVQLGSDIYTIAELEKSLDRLELIANQYKDCASSECKLEFDKAIKENFNVYKPDVKKDDQGFGKENYTLFTSYYSPDFTGSYSKTEEFKHGIFAKPAGKEQFAHSRVAIEFDDALAGKGLDLCYVKEPLFDIYLLHIEGGGRVKIKKEDGTEEYKYLSYTGSNKQRLRYIYKYMKEKGYLIEDFSISAQRKFLNENPQLQREIFEQTPSYIYFKLSDEEPVGVGNIPLTEKRSAAVDRRFYGVSGLIMFVSSKAPAEYKLQGETKPFSRFFFAQDTGGAIKGRARVDLYSGYGVEAELWANYMKQYGKLYFLALKKDLQPSLTK